MKIEQDLADFARIPLLAALDYEARRALAVTAKSFMLRTGDVVFRAGEASDGGYMLLNGSLEFQPVGLSARAQIIVPPALIGELALITDTTRPGSLTARAPSTVLFISRQLFQSVLKEHPRSARKARAWIESRLLDYSKALSETGQKLGS